ncbi:hypothetical protein [Streptomyces novaecaesareae]|uniref:hypothetical protein n=1 Tax=Streptomyces novaecaesareae TaxID=68244 RepID=UPI0009972F68|nr:hypothetical protein [Streptomyces novaecaesareae]
MRIHRTEHVRNFTVLPNGMLQCRRLSYTARGLLADLLSRPDGRREDGRQMADTSPQGRGAIRKALKELTDAGYYRVEKIRRPDGTIRSETHVYDTPQLTPPGATRPVPGEAATGGADALSKERQQEPSLPGGQPVAAVDEQLREAVATLFRVIRPEPRLRLGEAEARGLAPLVAQWLERGSSPADLALALLPGLPVPVHCAASVLRYRLEHKMPPAPPPVRPAAARYAECATCHDPVPQAGICGPCAGLTPRPVAAAGDGTATRTGAARARAALRAAKSAGLHLGGLAAA